MGERGQAEAPFLPPSREDRSSSTEHGLPTAFPVEQRVSWRMGGGGARGRREAEGSPGGVGAGQRGALGEEGEQRGVLGEEGPRDMQPSGGSAQG